MSGTANFKTESNTGKVRNNGNKVIRRGTPFRRDNGRRTILRQSLVNVTRGTRRLVSQLAKKSLDGARTPHRRRPRVRTNRTNVNIGRTIKGIRRTRQMNPLGETMNPMTTKGVTGTGRLTHHERVGHLNSRYDMLHLNRIIDKRRVTIKRTTRRPSDQRAVSRITDPMNTEGVNGTDLNSNNHNNETLLVGSESAFTVIIVVIIIIVIIFNMNSVSYLFRRPLVLRPIGVLGQTDGNNNHYAP